MFDMINLLPMHSLNMPLQICLVRGCIPTFFAHHVPDLSGDNMVMGIPAVAPDHFGEDPAACVYEPVADLRRIIL